MTHNRKTWRPNTADTAGACGNRGPVEVQRPSLSAWRFCLAQMKAAAAISV